MTRSHDVTAFLALLTAKGIRFELRKDRLYLLPTRARKELTDAERTYLREHRQELKRFIRDGPATEPEPEVYAYGRRVTEHDVRECLRGLGDDALRDFETGRLPKEQACAMTRTWLRQQAEMKRG